MVSWKIIAGGYDLFVATYLFTVTGRSSTLRLLSTSPTGLNTSWITQHPTNKHILYAVNEMAPLGALQSFKIAPDGSLSDALDTVSTLGADPAHVVALPNGKVVVMNYSTGDGRIIKTTHGGAKFNGSGPLIKFQVPPGTLSHPHQTVQYGDALLIPDLGADTIWRLQEEQDSDKVVFKEPIPQPKGSGPRHISIVGDRLFTLHELSSTLSVQPIPALNATSSAITRVSVAPEDAPAGAKWSAAEILIPPPTKRFPKSYIYVSNRNLGLSDPRGDTIAIFEHVNKGKADEGLVLVNQVHTGLERVRGMEFGPVGTGGDEYLVASGVTGKGGVAVLKRVDGGRNLKVVARNLEIPTRTTFVWL
ncbi:hypothetical protein H1R20_g16301, partial [Candolleomyces eurysporus]